MSGPQRKLIGPPEIVMAIKAYLFFFLRSGGHCCLVDFQEI